MDDGCPVTVTVGVGSIPFGCSFPVAVGVGIDTDPDRAFFPQSFRTSSFLRQQVLALKNSNPRYPGAGCYASKRPLIINCLRMCMEGIQCAQGGCQTSRTRKLACATARNGSHGETGTRHANAGSVPNAFRGCQKVFTDRRVRRMNRSLASRFGDRRAHIRVGGDAVALDFDALFSHTDAEDAVGTGGEDDPGGTRVLGQLHAAAHAGDPPALGIAEYRLHGKHPAGDAHADVLVVDSRQTEQQDIVARRLGHVHARRGRQPVPFANLHPPVRPPFRQTRVASRIAKRDRMDPDPARIHNPGRRIGFNPVLHTAGIPVFRFQHLDPPQGENRPANEKEEDPREEDAVHQCPCVLPTHTQAIQQELRQSVFSASRQLQWSPEERP